MPDTLNIALVGCGGMMGAHANGFKLLWEAGLRDFRIVATCDTDKERAQKMADGIAAWQGSNPTVYTSQTEMLKQQDDLHAVDHSLVHRIHHDLAIEALDAGKHLTLEKPLAMTIRAGHAIIAAARKNNRVLQVAENYRRSPGERAINWAIKSGRIGDLRMIFWVDVGERLWHWGWRDELDQAGGGWSMDGGVHFADLFRYHVGEVKSLYCVSKAIHPFRYAKPETREEPIPATTEDSTFAVLEFENGVSGNWVSTSAAPGWGNNYRAVYGSEGCIQWGRGLKARSEELTMEQLQAEYMAQVKDPEKSRWFPGGVTDTIASELYEFVQACLHGGPIEITGEEGLKDEAISLALYESSILNAPVSVRDVEMCKLEAHQARFNREIGVEAVQPVDL